MNFFLYEYQQLIFAGAIGRSRKFKDEAHNEKSKLSCSFRPSKEKPPMTNVEKKSHKRRLDGKSGRDY